MRIYDFKEYQRYHRVAREFGWSMRDYKEVAQAVDSLFDDLTFRSGPDADAPTPAPRSLPARRRENVPPGDSASAHT